MNGNRFDLLVTSLTTAADRRGLLRRLAVALPVLGALSALLAEETAAKGRRKRRKKRNKRRSGRGKAHRKGQKKGDQKDACAKSGQQPKQGKPCCKGLREDGSGRCAASGCTPSCPANTCGSQPDGCGGTMQCACANTQLCAAGICQTCDVCANGCAFDTVQEAINAGTTVDGDTLTICAGRYLETITISKSLTLIGAGDGDNNSTDTILDGNLAGRVILIGPGRVVTLQRLRVSRGRANDISGGGINNQGELTMTDCTVFGNESVGSSFGASGGGIAQFDGTALTMTNCTITNNRGGGLGGGAIFKTNGTFALTNCTLDSNSTSNAGAGGAINAQGSGESSLTNCTVSNNEAPVGGGLFLVSGGTINLDGTTVAGNSATSGTGGGIHLDFNTTVRLRNGSRVRDNDAATDGGGIRNFGTLEIDASFVGPNNMATNNGGGIVNVAGGPFQGSVRLLGGSVVSENNAGVDGGGIFNQGTVACTDGDVTDNTVDMTTPSNCVNTGSGMGCDATCDPA